MNSDRIGEDSTHKLSSQRDPKMQTQASRGDSSSSRAYTSYQDYSETIGLVIFKKKIHFFKIFESTSS